MPPRRRQRKRRRLDDEAKEEFTQLIQTEIFPTWLADRKERGAEAATTLLTSELNKCKSEIQYSCDSHHETEQRRRGAKIKMELLKTCDILYFYMNRYHQRDKSSTNNIIEMRKARVEIQKSENTDPDYVPHPTIVFTLTPTQNYSLLFGPKDDPQYKGLTLHLEAGVFQLISSVKQHIDVYDTEDRTGIWDDRFSCMWTLCGTRTLLLQTCTFISKVIWELILDYAAFPEDQNDIACTCDSTRCKSLLLIR
jgi:hypothetical protein